jgi:DNA-binding transcriptional MocR family regulator
MLRSGALQNHVTHVLIPEYRKRYYTLMSAITTVLLPLGVTIEVNTSSSSTAGGFFTYLRLPDYLPSARVIAAYALKEKNLRIAFGHMFAVTGDEDSIKRAEEKGGFASCVRLCWAWHEELELKDGIKRLGEAIDDVREMVKRGEIAEGEVAIGIR